MILGYIVLKNVVHNFNNLYPGIMNYNRQNNKNITLKSFYLLFNFIFIIFGIFIFPKIVSASPSWCIPVSSNGTILTSGTCGNFSVPTYEIGTQANEWIGNVYISSPPPNPSSGGITEIQGTNNQYHSTTSWINNITNLSSFFSSPSTGYYSIGFTSCKTWNGSSCTSFGYPNYDQDYGYAEWYYNGSSWSSSEVPPNDTSTRFTEFTYSTTTHTVNFKGYWNTGDELKFIQKDKISGDELINETFSTTTGSTTAYFDFTWNFNELPSYGTSSIPIYANYELWGGLINFSEEYNTRILLDSTSTIVNMSQYDLIETNSKIILENNTRECGITEITGCIENAFIYLFWPTTSIEHFKKTYETIQTKAPFIYVFQSRDLILNLYEGYGTTTGGIIIPWKRIDGSTTTIPLITKNTVETIPFIGLLKTLIQTSLYLSLIMVAYYQIIKIHDK